MAFDGLSARAMSVANWAASAAARALGPTTVARVGLGAMVFAAGVHKLLGPLSWSAYAAPWLTSILIVLPVTFVLANGVLEVGSGAVIVADRYTVPASAVAAVSLSMMCLYLAVVFIVEGGLFGDTLARGIGLAGLA